MTRELVKRIPKDFREAFAEIVDLTDAFCQAHLDEDYRDLCREMAAALCRKRWPVNRGRRASWASGIVHALGWVNFLGDPAHKPYMRNEEVAKGLGVSLGTMMVKSKTIRDALRIVRLDPDWCHPSLVEDNPLVWMLQTTGGFIIDIRQAPRELQVEAYEHGLIPYVPFDRQQGGPEAGQ